MRYESRQGVAGALRRVYEHPSRDEQYPWGYNADGHAYCRLRGDPGMTLSALTMQALANEMDAMQARFEVAYHRAHGEAV